MPKVIVRSATYSDRNSSKIIPASEFFLCKRLNAVAILLALASPEEINLLGLTAVAGNVPLNLTVKNARTICELAKMKNISIFKGCDKPLKRNLVTAEHVHGKTGLDGIILPEPTMPIKESHAVDFIIGTIRENPRYSITICALGPLTNIAMALEKAPDIAVKIKQIILIKRTER